MLKLTTKSQLRESLLVAGMLLLLPAVALAGGDVGNGGNTVHCKSKPNVILDYYEATLASDNFPQGPGFIEVEGAKHGEILELLQLRLEIAAPFFAKKFSGALERIGPLSSWSDSRLNDTKDSGEAYILPKGCVKRQAAVRQQESMFKDPKEIGKLSEGQRDLLVAHEAIYLLAEESGFTTSAPVRKVLKQLLMADFSPDALRKTIRSMKRSPDLMDQLQREDAVFMRSGGYGYAAAKYDANTRIFTLLQMKLPNYQSGEAEVIRGARPLEFKCEWFKGGATWPDQKTGFHTLCRRIRASDESGFGIRHRWWFSDDGSSVRVTWDSSDGRDDETKYYQYSRE